MPEELPITGGDILISDWVLNKWGRDGINIHEDEFGCKVYASNIKFGIASMGSCDTCYHEYPAVIFDVDCTCPAKIPSDKNKSGYKTNSKKFKIPNVDISGEFQLHDILNGILG